MKVTYLGHSGFAVELTHKILLFDYYTGRLPELKQNKTLIVFASHSHQDHFNRSILKLSKQCPDIHYFFGNDIRLGEKWLLSNQLPVTVKESVTKLSGGGSADWGDTHVQALRSTDSGVAFVVETEGKRIYHAGDLNWWHWEGEPEEENEEMGKNYRREIDKIGGMHFDLAFVPLDPRLEGSFGLGMDYFLEKTDSPVVFPMHLWEKYETIAAYKNTDKGKCFTGRVMDVDRGGQEWNI